MPCVDTPSTGGIDIVREDACAQVAPEGSYAGLLGDTSLMYGSGVGVYPNSGELYVTEVDLEIPGRRFDFKVERKYRSGVTYLGRLGRNWFLNYDERWLAEVTADNLADLALSTDVALAVGDVLRMDGFGRVDVYTSTGSTKAWYPAHS